MKIQLLGACTLAAGSLVSLSYPGLPPTDDYLEGVVHPFRVVHVGASAEGILEEVLIERGDHVTAGQTLGSLAFGVERVSARLAEARRDETADLQIARTRLVELEKQLERREQLFAGSIINAEELDETRHAVAVQELTILASLEDQQIAALEAERALEILEQGTIRSPLDGVVTERYLSPGELLSRSGTANLVTIAQLDPLLIDVHAPVELFQRFRVDELCRVELSGPVEREHIARVQVVDRLVDTGSDTFRVRLEMANPGILIPAGLRCRIWPPQ